jgi:hypothetical protein
LIEFKQVRTGLNKFEQVRIGLNKFEQEGLFKRCPNVIEQFMRQKKKLLGVSNGTKSVSNGVRIK